MKAVFLDSASLDQQDLDFQALQSIFDELILYPYTDHTTLLERVQSADVIISNKVVLDAKTLKQCTQLKLILISATGCNNVDLPQAQAQGIVVCNCQGYGTAAVAQHTLMFMLNLATSAVHYHHAVQQGHWNNASQFCLLDYPIIELSGKTLGILGYGELGQAVAKRAEAFEMQVLVGRLPNRSYTETTRVDLHTLLTQSDFITLHCPLTDDTRNLIDAQALKKMKKTAFLINCARGGIVNEAALVEALQQGTIAGAATDVLSVEPPKEGNILLDAHLPNLFITPHSAWGSVDARQRIVQQLAENAQAFKNGQPIRQVS